MTIDELVQIVNASQLKPLTSIQEWLLRSAWEKKTYSSMAAEKHYAEDYLRRVSGELWSVLSDFWGEPITKLNFRSILERRSLTQSQQQLIQKYRSQKIPSTLTPPSVEFPSGPVSLESKFYIERPPIEELAYSVITQPGCVLRIKAPKRMGKSSLTLRILSRATSIGYCTASVDFQQADSEVFASLNAFLRWFCANVSEELKLESKLDDYWKKDIGSKVNCTIYFQRYLLEQTPQPIVLVLNEVNRVFEYPEIAKDFLSMLRYWHEQAKRVISWQNLRQIVVYSTEIYIPLNLNQSPFNVGLLLKLPPFTAEQMLSLATRHGLDWTDSNAAQQLREMVGGHPYLARLAFYHLYRGEVDLDGLLHTGAVANGIYSEHLQSLEATLQKESELTAAFSEAIAAPQGVKLATAIAHKLESMGLVNLEGGICTLSCDLYRQYFAEQFLEVKSATTSSLLHLEKENENSQQLVNTDRLTQLAGRHYFDRYLERQWQYLAEKIKPLSLILCDLDRFKFYNDACGHQAGDACLQKVATTVKSVVSRTSKAGSSEGLVARYGGDEFAILLPEIDAFSAFYIADKIREEIKALAIEHYNPQADIFSASPIAISLGVACTIPKREGALIALVQAADEALYEAKRKGRDRVAVSSVLDYGLID